MYDIAIRNMLSRVFVSRPEQFLAVTATITRAVAGVSLARNKGPGVTPKSG